MMRTNQTLIQELTFKQKLVKIIEIVKEKRDSIYLSDIGIVTARKVGAR
jgi:hypothetical protein